jgi:glycosyltransferase involved in cell wall biosynthesis
MRILMVTQFYAPTIGGQERVVEDLSRELIARGHHVAVVALQQGGRPPVSDVSGVRVYRIRSTSARFFRGYIDPTRPHSPPAVDPKAARELRQILKLEKPDLVHGHDWLIHSYLPLKRRHGPGLVVTLHDQSLVCANKRLIRNGEACTGPGPAKCLRCSASHYGRAKGPAITVGNWVMSATERGLVDMFLPVSQVVADAARLRGRRAPHRVIPNFLPAAADSTAQGEKLAGLPRKFILFVGDVARDKGVGVLLEAHKLLEDPPPLLLIGRIVDPDALEPAFGPERLASAALLAAPIGNVRAVGPQPHEVVLDAFRRSTVTVVPSLMHEAFGLVAIEAMSAGLPVIASNIGGLPDIISDGKNGILVEPGDVEALRAALARVLANSALRSRLRAAAKRRAADFAADVIVPQVEQAYEEVLATRQRPPAHAERPSTPAGAQRFW